MATYYLDPTAANDGDGSAYTQAASGGAAGAYNKLSGHTFVAGDVVWCRRCNTSQTAWGVSQSLTTANITVIGWPISGDDFYSTRPAPPQTTWDADSAQFSVFRLNSAAQTFTMGSTSGTPQQYHRVEFHQDTAPTGVSTFQGVTTGGAGSRTKFYHCRWVWSAASTGSTKPVLFSGLVELFDCYLEAANTSSAAAFDFVSVSSGSLLRQVTLQLDSSVTGTGTKITWPSSSTYITLVDCTIQLAASYVAGAAAIVTAFSQAGRIDGLTVDCTNASGVGGYQVNFSNSQLDARRVTLKNVTLSQATQTFALLELVQWTEAPVNAAQTFTVGDMFVMSKTTRYASNSSAFNINSAASSTRPIVLARGVTWPVLPTLGVVGNGQCVLLYSMDHGGSAGQFNAYQGGMVCVSSSVARTGGSSYSLKFTSSGSDTPGDAYEAPIEIGIPEGETNLLDATAAAHTFTLYGAFKNFTNSYGNAATLDHIWFELRYLDGSRMRVASTSRSTSGKRVAPTSDSSTWTGDTGLTMFSIAIPVTIGTAGLQSVRYLSGWPAAEGGLIYIDPTIVVT